MFDYCPATFLSMGSHSYSDWKLFDVYVQEDRAVGYLVRECMMCGEREWMREKIQDLPK